MTPDELTTETTSRLHPWLLVFRKSERCSPEPVTRAPQPIAGLGNSAAAQGHTNHMPMPPRGHGIASAQAICPSKASDVAMAR